MPKEFSRTRRVGELVRRELAVLIASELNDPRVGMVTITAVDITKDLRLAKVRVTCLGS
ncbi:MAG: ribosome-binding factor A, partial [Gammaproteobacteria bacterium]|nr:ribosome-binding factor A [Gammaproteobacteria bacterium]